MRTTFRFGPLNEHAVGYIMKMAMNRAMDEIRRQRFTFEAQAKEGYDGRLDDLVTSADAAAQHAYLRVIREAFPDFGIIAEEQGLTVACRNLDLGDAYFTIDPLDGTKAFGRRQSHGIGSMIALVQDDKVVAAYIGDVMTREIYGYRPGSDKVHRISQDLGYAHAQVLNANPPRNPKGWQALLRHVPEKHAPVIERLMRDRSVDNIDVEGGSIGLSYARLWKGEIDLMVLRHRHVTPWDETPLIGICEKLGYVFFAADKDGQRLEPAPNPLAKQTYFRERDFVVVHRSRVQELLAWQDAHRP